ncbi:MAG: protein kinase [Rhodothermales bacterium]|nr:protein kinase [Rhodothermales bacterium]
MIGTTISHYKITDEIGRGGMGVVYKAEDTRLDRTVALKFFPPHALVTEDDRARFYREARAAAALHHPNIATVFEIDEVSLSAPGSTGEEMDPRRRGDDANERSDNVIPTKAGISSGSSAPTTPLIAMEYIEGETLTERVAKGPLPLKDVISIATQSAEALKAAHAKGIVHRDIKSGNIMLTSDGVAKILDFGLAKTAASTKLTQMGSTLGTFAYMSPEQARGEEVDNRSDLWSLGVVIYEMISGRMPFVGDYEQAVVYGILNQNPEPLTALRTGVSIELETIVEKCLRKPAKHRYQSAAGLIADLESLTVSTSRISGPLSGVHTTTSRQTLRTGAPEPAVRRWLIGAGAAALGFVLAWVLFGLLGRGESDSQFDVRHLSRITTGEQGEIFPALSPDGQMVAYVDAKEGHLYVRQLAGGRVLRLGDELSGQVFYPRWSPDQTSILFESGGVLYSVPPLGGPVTTIVREQDARLLTPTWSPDGKRIVYSQGSALVIRDIETRSTVAFELRVPHSPDWSPDGSRIAFVSGNSAYLSGNIAPSSVWILALDTGESARVTADSNVNLSPVWSPDGAGIFFVSDRGGGTDVYWQAIEGINAEGTPARVTVGLRAHTLDISSDGARLAVSQLAVSQNVFRSELTGSGVVSAEDAEPVTTGVQMIEGIAISPDGRRLAYDSNVGGNQDIYVRELSGGDVRRVTKDPADDFVFEWSPDGRELSFHSFRTGSRGIYTVSVEDLAVTTVIDSEVHERYPTWSSDGEAIAYFYGNSGEVRITRRSEVGWGASVVLEDFRGAPRWSPVGQEIATTGADGIYVARASDAESRSISLPDGMTAYGLAWSEDGRLLYFLGATGSRWGIWSVPSSGGVPTLRVDGGGAPAGFLHIAVYDDFVYFTTREVSSDIWLLEF